MQQQTEAMRDAEWCARASDIATASMGAAAVTEEHEPEDFVRMIASLYSSGHPLEDAIQCVRMLAMLRRTLERVEEP